MAAIPEFRRSILHVSAPARRQSRRGLGYPHGTASPVDANRTDTVPIAVPALVRNWWPMLFFMVFKSPSEGQPRLRPGEPMAQIILVPEENNFDLVDMTEKEAADRELRARRIYQARSTLAADTHWKSSTNTAFDGIYRHMLRAAKAKP